MHLCISALWRGEISMRGWRPNLPSKGSVSKYTTLKPPAFFYFSQCQLTGWWFQIFFMFTPNWGDDPIWLVLFKGAETTNQDAFPTIFPPPKKKFLWTPPQKKCAQKATHFLQSCFTPGNLEQVEHPQIIKPSVAFCNIYIIYTDNIYMYMIFNDVSIWVFP